MRINRCLLDANAVLYQVSREDIISNFRKLNNDVVILNADVLFRALEIFDKTPKLDFVDCLLYGYKKEKSVDIITFDRKLQKRLEDVICKDAGE